MIKSIRRINQALDYLENRLAKLDNRVHSLENSCQPRAVGGGSMSVKCEHIDPVEGGISYCPERQDAYCDCVNTILRAWDMLEEQDPDISTARLFGMIKEITGYDADDISGALYQRHVTEERP